jgi:ectoine hydroxylase-related dioxygenase (phytanoyl-CoA dioxygenase family)
LQLVYHKKLIGIAREALGPQVQFDLVDARITKSAKEVVEWHIHNQCVVEPAPLFPCYPHSIHVLVYLDDISEDNGALCVMPGSHRNPSNPCPVGDRAHEDLPGQVVISCPAGTSVVVHAHLWHRTISPRQREIDRRMLIVGFLPACVKSTTHQSDEFYRRGSPSERLTSQLRVGDDPEIRELLGEYFWP